MELRLLAYVVAVADAGSVAGAAEALHITQPTLSRQLRDLERRLGARLFVREPRRTIVTPAGAALVARARVLLDGAAAAEREVREVAAGRRGRLVLTFAGSGINGPLADALARFRAAMPRVTLTLAESFDDTAMSEGVAEGDYDIAVQRLPAADPRLRTLHWWQEPMTAFLPADHELARSADELAPSELARVPLVVWPRAESPQSYDEIMAIYRAGGVAPTIAAEARTVQTLLALASVGFGAAILADSFRALGRHGVVARTVRGTTTRISLVWHRDTLNPLVARFIDIATEPPHRVP
ncbi:LysR family transcriptional regulator [Pseudonocardia spinosispora]|uniref:LysR family transcriptional regulator n=1 Tax=Pseudonocardia spinosispora TaxID=103441 RepID=UPI000428A2A4|nr:LysR family transcriptional regulator [Pseudonocardia spinosispora]